MMSILFPAVLAAGAIAVSLAVVFAVAVRAAEAVPVEPSPFDLPGSADPSEDTLAGQSELVQTTKPTGTEWKLATVNTLSQVEDLLDSLEAAGVEEREVHALANNLFAVRWR